MIFQRLIPETKMTSKYLSLINTLSNDIIELVLKLQTFKKKYKNELEEVQEELYRTYMLLGKTQNRLDFLNYKKKRHMTMIENLNRLLRDIRGQMEEDLNQVKDICKDIPYSISKNDLIGLAVMWL